MSDTEGQRLRVLVTVPHPDRQGGIISYWQSIIPSLEAEAVLMTVGKRRHTPSPIERLSVTFVDTVRLCRALAFSGIDILQLNAGLDVKSLIREGLHLLLAKAFRKPVVVLFHGWRPATEATITRKYSRLFTKVLGRAEVTLVLCSEFRESMRCWGCRRPIHTTTTVIDPVCLEAAMDSTGVAQSVAAQSIAVHNNAQPDGGILFMARIIPAKGIHETLEAFRLALDSCSGLRLVIAGDGPELSAARAHVEELALPGVEFLGDVRGDQKIAAFRGCGVYVLPTRHAEGMPTTVLEAMAFGLIAIAPRVAGLKDFFADGELGLVLQSQEPREIADLMIRAITDGELRARIDGGARSFALSHFAPDRVASRLDAAYADAIRMKRSRDTAIADRDWYVETA